MNEIYKMEWNKHTASIFDAGHGEIWRLHVLLFHYYRALYYIEL